MREPDPEHRLRLPFACEGRLGPVALASGQPTDDHADDEEQDEVEPLLRVLHRQRVARLDEQAS